MVHIFADLSHFQMIREGQAKTPHPSSEPVDISGVAWPTLGGPAPKSEWATAQKSSGEPHQSIEY